MNVNPRIKWKAFVPGGTTPQSVCVLALWLSTTGKQWVGRKWTSLADHSALGLEKGQKDIQTGWEKSQVPAVWRVPHISRQPQAPVALVLGQIHLYDKSMDISPSLVLWPSVNGRLCF
jgi:hypothetical protein